MPHGSARASCVVAHGALRTVLARYLGVAPGAIQFGALASGKPIVAGLPISFNLAHSDGLAVCAVTTAGQIGVDLERLRRVENSDSIVQKYFSPGELRQYSATRPAERTAAFFSAWTRKEAFVKAIGAGPPRDLSSFEVEVSPQAVQPWVVSQSPDAENWSLRAFVPRPQYVAAVALDREIDALEFFEWSSAAMIGPAPPAAVETIRSS